MLNVLGENGLNCVIPKSKDKRICVCVETRKALSESIKKIPKPPMSQEVKDRIRTSTKGRLNHNAVRLQNTKTGIIYGSFTEAANALGLNYGTFHSRVKKGFKNTRFVVLEN